jgi:nucleoside-diphosphate-sugar epimerase
MILVTGGSGLSGSYVIRELKRRGHALRALARATSAGKMSLPGVEIAIGDLTDPDSVRRACESVTGIVHAACTFTDSRVDIAAMQALLDGWRHGPFVFFSSLDVYGLSQAPLITEDEPLDETYTDYATGKVLSERLLTEAARRQRRTDYSILRAPHIWAPHPTAYQRLIGLIGDKDTVVLPGAIQAEWTQYRDAWIDARDLAWIVAGCLEHPIGGPVNVLAGHFAWHDLYAEIIRLTGRDCRIVHKPLDQISDDEQPQRVFRAQSWRYDDRKLRDTLGFQPSHTWQQTLAETLDAGALRSQTAAPKPIRP